MADIKNMYDNKQLPGFEPSENREQSLATNAQAISNRIGEKYRDKGYALNHKPLDIMWQCFIAVCHIVGTIFASFFLVNLFVAGMTPFEGLADLIHNGMGDSFMVNLLTVLAFGFGIGIYVLLEWGKSVAANKFFTQRYRPKIDGKTLALLPLLSLIFLFPSSLICSYGGGIVIAEITDAGVDSTKVQVKDGGLVAMTVRSSQQELTKLRAGNANAKYYRRDGTYTASGRQHEKDLKKFIADNTGKVIAENEAIGKGNKGLVDEMNFRVEAAGLKLALISFVLEIVLIVAYWQHIKYEVKCFFLQLFGLDQREYSGGKSLDARLKEAKDSMYKLANERISSSFYVSQSVPFDLSQKTSAMSRKREAGMRGETPKSPPENHRKNKGPKARGNEGGNRRGKTRKNADKSIAKIPGNTRQRTKVRSACRASYKNGKIPTVNYVRENSKIQHKGKLTKMRDTLVESILNHEQLPYKKKGYLVEFASGQGEGMIEQYFKT